MLLPIFLCLIQLAHAGPKAAPKVIIWSRNPDSTREIFKGSDYKVLDHEDLENEWKAQGYLPKEHRDRLFHQLDLDESVRALSAVQKDILILSVPTAPMDQLHKRYPTLSEGQLRKLKTALKEYSW